MAILFLLMVGIVNLPFAHTYITNKTNSVLNKNGIPLHVGKISLLLNGKIGLKEVRMIQPQGDTIIYAGEIRIFVNPVPLFSKKIEVVSLNLKDVTVNLLTDSITGNLNIISAFNPSGKKADKKIEQTAKSETPWEIEAKSIHLKNVRFLFESHDAGIMISEKLAKAKIDFDTFSILKKQIDIGKLEIDNSSGELVLWENRKTETDATGTPADWKFSAKDFEINDLDFTFNQPDIGRKLDVQLKKGEFSLEKIDLANQEILVREIGLNKPVVNFFSSKKNEIVEEVSKSSESFEIPAIPWTIEIQKLKIDEGYLNQKSEEKVNTGDERWMPVQGLNASFDNIVLSPAGYSLNLRDLSFALSNTLKLKSGSLKLNTDKLQNIDLSLNLSSGINSNRKSWFSKDTTFSLNIELSGSAKSVNIKNIDLKSTSGFDFHMNGQISDIFDMQQTGCNLQFKTGNITKEQISSVINLVQPAIQLPDFTHFTVSGKIGNKLLFPVFKVSLASSSGNVDAEGKFDIKNLKGDVNASFTDILLSSLFGNALPERISGNVKLNGGINKNQLPDGEAFIKIDSVTYKNKTTRNIELSASGNNGEFTYTVNAADTSLNCNVAGTFAITREKAFKGSVNGHIKINLAGLNLSPNPLALETGIDAGFEYSPPAIDSYLKLNDFTVSNQKSKESVKKTEFYLKSTDSLIISDLESDFLSLSLNSKASFADFQKAFESTNLKNVINLDSTNFINLKEIAELSPFNLDVKVSHDPVFNLFIPDSVLDFSDIALHISKATTDSQIETKLTTDRINYNKVNIYQPHLNALIDNGKISIQAETDSVIANEIKSRKSGINFEVAPGNILGELEIFADNDSVLHDIGFQAKRERENVIFSSTKPEWIINRIPWSLSPPVFMIFNTDSKNLVTELSLASDNKHLELKGNLSDMTELKFSNFELSDLEFPGLSGLLPEGTLNGNVTFNRKENDKAELNLVMDDMKWNDFRFNQIAANGYLIADSTGIPDSKLLITADDSMTVDVQVKSDKVNDEFEIESEFDKIRFQLLEPFISDFAGNLHGVTGGKIKIATKKSNSSLNGEIRFNDFGLKIVPLQAWLIVPDNKISIKDNLFIFNDFTVIDSLGRPLKVNGNIKYVNSDEILVDLNVDADRINLMNITESPDVPLFGSLIVNSSLKIGGSLYHPSVKGSIELENGTNLTYQMIQDISVGGNQKDVVFASINDSMQIIYPENLTKEKTTNLPLIETTVRINPNSVFNLKVSDVYNVDIKISGNGLLNYNILPNNTMSLNGNYQIQTGECKLKITGWPLKNFVIKPGSSFNWNGSVDNPFLDLEATSRIKGSYTNPIDNKNRVVDFIVSMKLKNQLSNLDILFDIQSNDQYITSVLNALSRDELMRQAINLLLFETIEIPGVESSGNYLMSQVNSFWESGLNTLTSEKLNKTKLSFGIDTYNQSTASGGQQEKTSFTYEMEHKFKNDRATIKLSGRLNDYNEGAYQTNSLFENFIFEYALDSMNTKNLKLYEKRDYEDMLEGEVVKYGFGFLYRKNYKRLSDIWRSEKKSKAKNSKSSNGQK